VHAPPLVSDVTPRVADVAELAAAQGRLGDDDLDVECSRPCTA